MNIDGSHPNNGDEDEDFAQPSAAPGARPIPDDQGDLEVCTRFAISKAVVDGFMRKMFVRGREVDIDQDQVTMVLLNEHKDGTGKWPDEFHHKVYQFKDSEARYWKTNLFVHKMTDVVDFVNDVMNKIQLHTYVLVYPLYPGNPSGPKHCVYADNLDPRTRNIECINSDPSDPYPDIPISRKGNVLYRVSCTASEMTLGHVTSPGHRAPLTTGTVRMREKPPRKPSDNSSQNKRYSSPCNRYNQGIQGKMCHMSHSRTSLNSSGIGSRRDSRRVSESSDGGVSRRLSGFLSAGSESNRNSRRISESSDGGAPRRLSGLLSSPHHGSIPRAKSAISLNTIQDQEIRGRLSQTAEEEQYYEADYHHSPPSSSEHRDHYPQHFTFDASREQTNIPRNSSEPALQHYFLPTQTDPGQHQTDSHNNNKSKSKFGSMKSLFKIKK